jgi:hypothetical protein
LSVESGFILRQVDPRGQLLGHSCENGRACSRELGFSLIRSSASPLRITLLILRSSGRRCLSLASLEVHKLQQFWGLTASSLTWLSDGRSRVRTRCAQKSGAATRCPTVAPCPVISPARYEVLTNTMQRESPPG